jgi:hypothetical protein
MDDGASDESPGPIPVDPTVHVESFGSQCTLTWKAHGLSQFVDAVRTLAQVSATAATVVDDTAVAGRTHLPLSEVEESDTVQYLRVEPETPWTASWERRTWPVVSMSGRPTASICRQVHLETTDCEEWDETAFAILCRCMDGTHDEPS